MDKKTYAIGILTVTAVALLLGNLFAPRPAEGVAWASNDAMQAVTARTSQGGDALYVLDHGSGKLAIFTVDNRAGLRLQTVVDVESGFRQGGAAPRGR